jgi:hypothetical protein
MQGDMLDNVLDVTLGVNVMGTTPFAGMTDDQSKMLKAFAGLVIGIGLVFGVLSIFKDSITEWTKPKTTQALMKAWYRTGHSGGWEKELAVGMILFVTNIVNTIISFVLDYVPEKYQFVLDVDGKPTVVRKWWSKALTAVNRSIDKWGGIIRIFIFALMDKWVEAGLNKFESSYGGVNPILTAQFARVS